MQPIHVTQSYLPPIEEYNQYLGRIWQSKWVTNRGPLVLELEEKIKNYLNINNIIITNNGTIPLQIALKLFGKQGEIITTPFSYVATSASIVWENCKPVFVDIHPDYFTIDESKIENAITKKTTAILATHVFGNPCNVDVINVIAKKNNLKVIYDAAHAFGVCYNGQSLFNYGDVSTCSFHATKLFHTGEGGALFFNKTDLYEQFFYSHNFGHNGQLDFFGLGINGKISELQSAMGLAVYNHIDEILESRKQVVQFYNQQLLKLQRIKIRENTDWNYSYYPVVFETEEQLLLIEYELNKNNIFPRRYFYPSLNTINYLMGQEMPISESIAKRILCLPLYVGLTTPQLEKISNIINKKH
jgi:dTDP-4-amino-4,6-dideoxygalactose transaminase